jgi:predicted transcriptional regulator
LSKAIKAGAIVGVGDAVVNTIDKIAKGESFTISDARRIINGISSGVTLKRTGLLTPKTKDITTPELTIKSKNKDLADIKLTENELKQISETASEEQIGKMVKIISERTGKSANEIKDLFDLNSVVKTVKRPQ